MAFRLESSAADTLVVAGDLDLPDAWRVVTPSGRVSVPPGEAEVILMGVVPSDRAWPRCLSLTYRVRRARQPREPGSWLASASRPICVAERPELGARLVGVPTQVIDGDGYEASLWVVNTGNVSVGAAIEPNGHGAEVRPGRDSILVAAGGSTTIPVAVEMPRKRRAWEHVLQIRLVPHRDGMPAPVSTSRVPVIPRATRRSDSHQTGLRSSATARTGQGAGDVAPFEVRGSGPVPVGEGGSLTFLARGPSTRWSSRGLGDEYRARLKTRRMNLRLGDGHYRLSRLTESGRYAFGGSLERSVGAWTFGALVNGARGKRDLSPEWGGFAGVEAGDHASFRVNYLQREERGWPGSRSPGDADDGARIASAEAGLEIGSALRLAGEAGHSWRGESASTAYTATLSGRLSPLSYRFSRVRGEASYPNAYGGVIQNLARLGIDLWSFARVEGFYSDHRLDRPGRGGDLRRSRRRRTRQVGGGLSLGSHVSIRARQRRRAGRLRGREYRARWRSLEASTAWSVGGVRVEADGELGRVRGSGAGGTGEYRSLALSTGVASRGDGRLTVGVEGFDGYRPLRSRRERSVRMLLDAELPVRSNLEIGLFGEARWILNRDLAPAGHVRARLSYELPFGHELGLRSRIPVGASIETDELEVLGAYTVPFQIPTGDGEESTRLRGEVVNETSGTGVGGVMVRVGGRSAVTGEDGAFSISGLSPGRHYLRPALSTLDADLATVESMPRVVQVAKGTDARVRIGVARPGTISGRVRIRRRTSVSGGVSASDTATTGLPQLLVILSGPGGTYRATTDATGGFTFERIPPGSWSVSIEPDRLPAHHSFERTSADVTVKPGGQVHAEFLATPEMKQIRVIDEGEVKTSDGGGR